MTYHYWRRRPAYAISICSDVPAIAPMASRFHDHGGREAGFGVRRPLRYLRYQLDLDESQTRRVAAVLNRLKLEREQGAVDEKRAVHAVADLVADKTPLQEELQAALAGRVQLAEKLQTEVGHAVREMCETLDDDQRQVFADMLRGGSITI